MKLEPSCTAVKLCRHYSLAVSQKVTELMWPSSSTSRCIPKRIENWRIQTKTCPGMFIAAFFIMTRKWKQLKCPSTDEWINKIWYTHAMWPIFSQKRNLVLIHVTTWMNPQNVMHSERSQTPEATYCMILFKCNIQNRQIRRHRKQVSGCQGLGGGGNGEWLLYGYWTGWWKSFGLR